MNGAMISTIMDNAIAINELCDNARCGENLRATLHRMHGELLVRGCTDPEEIKRMVASRLEREAAQNITPLTFLRAQA